MNYTLDMFIDSGLKIYAEIMLEVSQNLMNRSGNQEDIRKIYTHPQVPGQCRQWLEKNMSGVPILDAPSTARAAEMAKDAPEQAPLPARWRRSCTASRSWRKRSRTTPIISPGSSSSRRNRRARPGRDKTSIMFSIKDKVGALHNMLTPFAEAGINLNRLDARPSGRQVWDYVFFLDMEGHVEEPKVAQAIERLKKDCLFLKVLGSYPKSQ